MNRKRIIITIALLTAAALSLSAQQKPDALKLYRTGRDLESMGRMDEANASYQQSVTVCKQELAADPKNSESYVVMGWALFRLGKYQEAINVSQEALKINPREFRVMETMGECYFYLDKYKESLQMMEKYIDGLPSGERISTAYFFVGEIYRLTQKYNRADIAYTMAVFKEPGISLWWYRLGSVRETVGDKNGAKTAYERAIRLRPGYKEATEALSRVNS